MLFRSADEAVAAYARWFDQASTASRPQEMIGHAWAKRCQRRDCASVKWKPVWSKRRATYMARCARCGTLWPGERVILCGIQRSSKNPRDAVLAQIATLHLHISSLPTWERRILVAFVLCPDPGRRSDILAEDFNDRWPWELHAKEIHAACEVAEEFRPNAAGGRSRERRREWTPYRVRLLLRAARVRLEEKLSASGMLASSFHAEH